MCHVNCDHCKQKRSTEKVQIIKEMGGPCVSQELCVCNGSKWPAQVTWKFSHGLFEMEVLRLFPSVCPVSCAVARFKYIMCQWTQVSILFNLISMAAQLLWSSQTTRDSLRSSISLIVTEHLMLYFASVYLFTLRAMDIRERRVNNKNKTKRVHTHKASNNLRNARHINGC